MAEHVAIVLHRGPAARGVDDHGVQPVAPDFGHEGGNAARRRGLRLGGLAHVMGQCPAAALTARNDHLAAQTAQQADGGIVDVGVQGLLRAACHQGHAHPARSFGGKDLWIVVAADGGDLARSHRQHGFQPGIGHQKGKGPPDLCAQQGQAEPRRIGQDVRQHPAQDTIGQRASVGLLDILPRVIHQMHVMHAGRTGRHAGQAGQAAVDMPDRALVRRAALFQHVLDQVDAPARAVQLVAQHLIGRAGRGAKTAMHAGPQDLVRPGYARVFQLLWRECRLHRRSFRVSPSGRGSGCHAGRTLRGVRRPGRPRGQAAAETPA